MRSRRASPADQLAGDVADVESYVDGLRRTVDEATADPVASALEATGRASEALAAAREAPAGVDDDARAELEARIDDAGGKLRTAERAFAKGAERPLLALRLAGEVERTSAEVTERARKLQALPGLVGRRLSELDRATARAERELVHVKDEFDAVSREYAPACWSEIRGVGAAADQAARQARRYAAAAAARPPGEAVEAKEELDAAFRALERAGELTRRIALHLRRLEDASLTARERVASAERAVETASADSAGDEERLARAARLAAQAREELGKRRPDWLRAVDLADRARELAALPEPPAAEAAPPAGIDVLREELAAERARAKETRDEAWAHGLVSVERDATVRPLLDDLEAAYQQAVARDATVAEGDAAGERDRIVGAIEAYHAFGRRAGSVRSEVADAYDRSLASRRRRALPADDEATLLVWGAATVAAAFLRER